MKTLLSTLFLTVGLIFGYAQTPENNYPTSIPEFKFDKIKGDGVFESSTINTKKKVIIGYVSPECIHCLIALEHYSDNINFFNNTVVILVTEYDKEVFIAKMKEIAPKLLDAKNVEILQDKEYLFPEKFNLQSLPTFYLYENNKLITVKRGSIEANQLLYYLK